MKSVEVVIDEQDIEPAHALEGTTNAAAVVIAGQTFGATALVFRGFAGALDPDAEGFRYRGVYRFDAAAGDELPMDWAAHLPGVDDAPLVAIPEPEPEPAVDEGMIGPLGDD